ncbi:MAG: cytochrome b [Betaproteobacteria bacterium]|nr:cytochrome b [Betaproteobacteria bacterium]
MTIPARYTSTAIALHWLIFALVAAGFSLAVYMVDLPLSPLKLRYFSWHKWIGVTVFMLALVRLAWRLTHPAPSNAAMPRWQQRAASAGHAALYALIIIIPISGWLYSSAAGVQTVYLGVVALPDLVGKDKALAQLLKSIHVTLNYTLLGIVIVHAAAALRHHFFDRDDVLKRMLPQRINRKG